MKKAILKKMPKLIPTDEMFKLSKADKAKVTTYYYSKSKSYDRGRYIRSCVEDGILKLAVFLTEDLKKNATLPAFEIYLDKDANDFVTWETTASKWRESMWDSLYWPSYVLRSGDYVSKDDETVIQNYFSWDQDAVACIRNFQYQVRAMQLEKSYKLETDPWDESLKKTPEIPADWTSKADKLMKQQYIFYTYDKKGVKTGYCSYCKKEVPVIKPKHNQTAVCQCCNRPVQFKARGRAGHINTDTEKVHLIQECDSGFVIRTFNCWRQYAPGAYETPKIHCSEERRAFYDSENRQQEAFEFCRYRSGEIRWVKKEIYSRDYYPNDTDYGWYERTYNAKTYVCAINNSSALSRTGIVEMAKSEILMDPETYINAAANNAYIERLAKVGLYKMAYDVLFIKKRKKLHLENHEELTKNLGIDKMRLDRLKKNNGSIVFLSWLQYEKSRNTQYSDEVFRFFESHELAPEDVKDFLKNMSAVKTCNFIKKQADLCGMKVKDIIQMYKDYIKMATRLKMDLNKEIFFKPKNLRVAHDEAVLLCNGKETALRAGEIIEKYPDVDNICQSIKEKYSYGNEKFTIIVPDKVEDIIHEGEVLKHCVGSHDIYFDRIQNHETYIVFLRHTEELDKPYYTLEIEPNGTIRQKRTTGDKQNEDIEEAKKFFAVWQKKIQKNLSEEDYSLAKKSKILREEEFKKLREDNTKIRNGVLRGRLLVDVLEEDLMEIEEEMKKCC